jgi:hypothetical protein
MLTFLLLAAGAVLASAALAVGTVWASTPRSNADFEWLDV